MTALSWNSVYPPPVWCLGELLLPPRSPLPLTSWPFSCAGACGRPSARHVSYLAPPIQVGINPPGDPEGVHASLTGRLEGSRQDDDSHQRAHTLPKFMASSTVASGGRDPGHHLRAITCAMLDTEVSRRLVAMVGSVSMLVCWRRRSGTLMLTSHHEL